MIEVRDLVKDYGGHLAVDHLSFTVEKGQIYGFLGPNGAGKSTTMNIITGYTGMTSGEVIVNGYNIAQEPEKARRCIGYLPELPPLYTDMTAREYLEFAAELKKIPKAQQKENIDEVVRLTGIENVQGRLIKNLSKGYRQRVGLAQAILGFPEVIILDEPTVGLDPKQILDIRELIKSLAHEHTVILSSHILSEVQAVCDHVIIIHHGRLLASGTPEQLEAQMRSADLEVVVKTDRTELAKEIFSQLPNVKSVDCSTSGEETTMHIKADSEQADIRENVFNACVQADMPLLMMRPEGVSLETVFLQLTADSAQDIAQAKATAINAEKEAQ